MIPEQFNSIRPLNAQEVPEAIEALLNHPAMEAVFNHLSLKKKEIEDISALALTCKNVLEFKQKVATIFIDYISKKTTFSLSLSGRSRLEEDIPCTYISNHRDIILDSAFLNLLLYQISYKMPQVAIGDNLLIEVWIEQLVRLCGCFIVRRNLEGRSVLTEAKTLSEYMHYNILHGESQWIAQREGRAKDSNDLTQISVLKMLAMGGEGSVVERLAGLNIVPLSVSYEYDPCDYLKAREMQYKRDNANYKKTAQEDALNMQTGLFSYKGRVHFTIAGKLNDILDQVSETLPKQQQYEIVAELINREIFKNYRLYPSNYIALDIMYDNNRYSTHYSAEEKQLFIDYILGQVAKIELEEGYTKDIPFLYACMIKMYATPAMNKEKTIGSFV
ncbi:1-acyl-sn-glycerol-3-phosphate acyltransferase [Porphyromonas macacae]|uniref:1-acyl-sn-glycerol-3-phosphate acyltransferase n=1 Tax=Porphyromonas macacae TaxID=28115 RepID=UPI00068ED79B|nr:1-acyl-sn-glycerol-3-phosphate acyltransferase [Porphyromonas macacae]